ncbi:MAG: NGG1p interacting factor NIF3 [Desulfamplus sp.]|nr:NGG1p interacting factor NIF3 [Desulfamplus sp.]
MYLISFYVPESHLKLVTESLFNKGAGRVGNYDSCSWFTKGVGQFRPLDGSLPFAGRVGRLEQIEEIKVEMVCENSLIKEAIQELLSVHPYETPAYHAIEILTLDDLK